MVKQAHIHDVIIVGGGLAGLSLTCLLGQRGMDVVCLDAADQGERPHDLRTTAISFGSRKILEKAGIWQNISQSCAIEDIQILDGSSPVLLEFLSGEVDGKAFGWIVDNFDLKKAMLKRLRDLKNVVHIASAQVSDFAHQNEYNSIIYNEDQILQARLIVGADGRNSAVRAHMVDVFDVRIRQHDYRQRAVICTVEHEHPHQNIAVEHFFAQGPFAVLPMADDKGQHRSSVVFTEHGAKRDSLMHLSDDEFNAALAARFPARYGDVAMVGRRVSYPLSLVHAAEYIASRMVLVADAAHGIHPIAGQGLNLGFRDLDALDELLGAAFARGGDLGDVDLLSAYQRKRRPDNMAMVAMTDALNRLFSNNIIPVRLLRRVGLRAVSRLKPAKDFFMKQAMGDR